VNGCRPGAARVDGRAAGGRAQRGVAAGEVAEQRLQLAVGARRAGAGAALVELLDGQPPF